jgi:hypothetical protein
MNLSGPMAPHPNWQVFGPDLRTYRDHNAIGVFMEGESVGVTHLVELKVYLEAHLLWDPSRDPQAVIDEFLTGYYGKAAPALRETLAVLEDRVRGIRLSWYEGPDAYWLDLATMNRATDLLDQAEAAAAGDSTRLARVRRARLAFDHQWLYGYWGYREQATRSGVPFRGPADPAAAAAGFAARVRAEMTTWSPDFMTRGIPGFMGKSFDTALADLTTRAVDQPPAPGPLPAQFQGIAGDRIIDIDERLANVFTHAGAAIVADPKASNGKTMRVPKAPAPSWAVQAKTKAFAQLGGFGRYHVYAVVRCDLQAETSLAFVGGVWDDRNRAGLGAVSFPIGKPAPPATAAQIDANPEIRFTTVISGAPVTDGEYHVYDFGVYDLPHNDISVWVGTTTGDIYVDRFVFVKDR